MEKNRKPLIIGKGKNQNWSASGSRNRTAIATVLFFATGKRKMILK